VFRTNSPVQLIERQGKKFFISVENNRQEFDALIVSTPAYTAAELLKDINPAVAAELRQVSYTSSVTVNLICDGSVRAALPHGFGFLVPRSEGRLLMAATFVHQKFPHRAPENRALLRCFVGSARNSELMELPDDNILSIVQKELSEILGFAIQPLSSRISRWKQAMAQYEVGHMARLERIDSAMKQLPCLALAGNAYRGIGIPDCIRSGSEAAGKVLAGIGVAPTYM
jgi:protoporphyrinogen/coproporphyrinogen III oxidase